MEKLIEFVEQNFHWIFSGIGVFILSIFFLKKTIKRISQKQKIGDNSTGIQVGGDLIVRSEDSSNDEK